MSNLPELLRTKAEGLRKEAQEQVHTAEVAFYAAHELVKTASENDAMDTSYKLHMMEMARRQAEAAEKHGILSAANSRLSRITPEDLAELKSKIAAMEGLKAAHGSAFDDAPASIGIRTGVGAAIGAGVGGLVFKSPLAGAAVGALSGMVSAVAAKDRYAHKAYNLPDHAAVGAATRDNILNSYSNTDVERKVISLAERGYNPSYPVEDMYTRDKRNAEFYKQACLEALQDLVQNGQVDIDVAEATLQELDRRLA